MPSSSVTSINRYPGELQPLTCVIFFFLFQFRLSQLPTLRKRTGERREKRLFVLDPSRMGNFTMFTSQCSMVYKEKPVGLTEDPDPKSAVYHIHAVLYVPTFPSLLMLNSQIYEQ